MESPLGQFESKISRFFVKSHVTKRSAPVVHRKLKKKNTTDCNQQMIYYVSENCATAAISMSLKIVPKRVICSCDPKRVLYHILPFMYVYTGKTIVNVPERAERPIRQFVLFLRNDNVSNYTKQIPTAISNSSTSHTFFKTIQIYTHNNRPHARRFRSGTTCRYLYTARITREKGHELNLLPNG